jgi:hypothetical protein
MITAIKVTFLIKFEEDGLVANVNFATDVDGYKIDDVDRRVMLEAVIKVANEGIEKLKPTTQKEE